MVIKFKLLKDWVRQFMESIPFNIGLNILKIYVYLIGRRKKIFYEKREAERIIQGIFSGEIKKALIVYDIKVSPPTYGDFFYMVMLARYFVSQNLYVNFVVIDDGCLIILKWLRLTCLTGLSLMKV